MKKFHKLLAVCVASILVVCAFCVSVSADTIRGFDSVVAFDSDGFEFHLNVLPGKDEYWTQGTYIPEAFYGSLYLCTDVNFTLDSSNFFKWESFEFGLWNFGDYSSSIYEVSFVLLDDDYNTLTVLHDCHYSNADFWQSFFTIPSGSFSSSSTVDVRYVAFCITFTTKNNSTLYYYTNGYETNFTVINSQTAEQEKTNEMLGEITADKYEPPSGQEQMDELGEQEEIVNQSAQEGLDEVGGMFKAFSLDFFIDGLGAVVQIYNHIVPKIPWLNEIILVSLSLGIFAFLLGTTHSVRSSREGKTVYGYNDPKVMLPEHKQR